MGRNLLNMIIVDTDILIDAGRNVDDALACLEHLEDQFQLAISNITQMELIVGCENKNELQSLGLFLENFQVIHVNEQISDAATGLLNTYRLSHGLLIPDALIAATSITTDIPFISKNQRDYRFIEKLKLLPYPNPF